MGADTRAWRRGPLLLLLNEGEYKMKHNVIEYVVRALEDYYAEHHSGKSMEYTFGFMDALAAVREMSEDALAPVRFIGPDAG